MPEENTEEITNFVIYKNRPLGSGAYGQVFVCRSKLSQEEFACKITKCQDQEDYDYCLRESETLKKIDACENIVRQIEFQADPKQRKIYVMMYLMDGTLEDILEKRSKSKEMAGQEYPERIPELEALNYFYQILKGLKSIHQKEVIHRDLKPDNIFFEEDKLLLGDFNLSSTSFMATSRLGTPLYTCPLIYSEKEYSGYVDLWSAGLILYRIIFGKHLYSHINVSKRVNSIEEFIKSIRDHLKTKDDVLFPPKPTVTADTKQLLKEVLDIQNVKNLTASDLLRKDIFKRYVTQEKYESKVSQVLETSARGLGKSTLNMNTSAFTRASQIVTPKVNLSEMDPTLKARIQQACISQQKKVGYIRKIFRSAAMYFNYFDNMKNEKPQQYQNFAKHHQNHIFFMTLIKGICLIEVKKNLDMMKNYEKFEAVAKDFLDFQNYTQTMKDDINSILTSTDLLRNFKVEVEQFFRELDSEFQNHMELIKSTYKDILNQKNKGILALFSDIRSASAQKITDFNYSVERFWPAYLTTLSNLVVKKTLPHDTSMAAKDLVLLFYHFAAPEEKINPYWDIMALKALNLTQEEEEQIFHKIAAKEKERTDLKKRKSQIQNIGLFIFIVFVIAAILGNIFLKAPKD